MEYSVGSLSDLITGSNTPNKQKVVKKKFQKHVFTKLDEADASVPPPKSPKTKKESPKWWIDIEQNVDKKKAKKQKSSEITLNCNEQGEQKKPKKLKKRKINVSVDHQSTFSDCDAEESKEKKAKLSQNDENAERRVKKKVKKSKLNDSLEQSTLADCDDEESEQKKPILTKNDVNAERRVKKKVKEVIKDVDPEKLERTIYVGNVPITATKKEVKQHYRKYGTIESIRMRCIPVANPKTTKKVAAIKQEFHPNVNCVTYYIIFDNKEDALKAEAENGLVFKGHHQRVQTCGEKDKPDESKAIFVGNLILDVKEDELWSLFEPCGPIDYVRIPRDKHTRIGRGFAYVNFKNTDAVQLALEMENVQLRNREVRISLCNINSAKKNKKKNQQKQVTQAGQPKSRKYRQRGFKGKRGEVDGEGKNFGGKRDFQGARFSDKNKKNKVNRGLMEKKKLIKQIAPWNK